MSLRMRRSRPSSRLVQLGVTAWSHLTFPGLENGNSMAQEVKLTLGSRG
jgi:hypothetical protein